MKNICYLIYKHAIINNESRKTGSRKLNIKFVYLIVK